jgi:hypothetical protein
MQKKIALIFTMFVAAALSQNVGRQTSYEQMPAIERSNDKLQLTVLTTWSSIASVVLADDPAKLNPLWNPVRIAREQGRPITQFSGSLGHFVCVDGFGQPSADERAAGLMMHGEGHVTKYNAAPSRNANLTSLTLNATLPIVQENFTRTFHMVDGENVIYVDSVLESLLGFDRPITWAEHMTFSSPFLEPGKVTFAISGTRSQDRPYATAPQAAAGRAGAAGGSGGGRGGATQRRLVSGADFTWPMAPGLDGKPVDLSQVPDNPHYIDHAATLFDPARKLEWVTALHSSRHLIYGYFFRREDYPWVQHWGNFPGETQLVRAMEIGTQPYDLARRIVFEDGPMFGAPVWRWLPAKSKIESHFILFFAHVPEGFNKVDDVKLENGKITIEDHTAQKTIVLAASRGIQVN